MLTSTSREEDGIGRMSPCLSVLIAMLCHWAFHPVVHVQTYLVQ